jgi:hypothetical protein
MENREKQEKVMKNDEYVLDKQQQVKAESTLQAVRHTVI